MARTLPTRLLHFGSRLRSFLALAYLLLWPKSPKVPSLTRFPKQLEVPVLREPTIQPGVDFVNWNNEHRPLVSDLPAIVREVARLSTLRVFTFDTRFAAVRAQLVDAAHVLDGHALAPLLALRALNAQAQDRSRPPRSARRRRHDARVAHLAGSVSGQWRVRCGCGRTRRPPLRRRCPAFRARLYAASHAPPSDPDFSTPECPRVAASKLVELGVAHAQLDGTDAAVQLLARLLLHARARMGGDDEQIERALNWRMDEVRSAACAASAEVE
ncbi:hypothetical protein PsYK624_128870 [Phanerochaete sordida]|uniref:Uncharacterized protein n=1 Tax=Phanerochaete sordida TaxID=48140 RepID=A0A9P3LJH7_9APHY|nr:hypothetical protein PsYK624_128870 [Phanerochaete sordida]